MSLTVHAERYAHLPDKRKKQFIGSCTVLEGQAINDMKDHSDCLSITRQTFLKHVDTELLWDIERNLGYERYASCGLTMAGDWHVSYHKSIYNGFPCVFFSHSAIEYVFV